MFCVSETFLKQKKCLFQIDKSIHYKVQRKDDRQLSKQQNQCKGKLKVNQKVGKKRLHQNEWLKMQTFKYVFVGWITHYNYFLHFNHARESVETAREQCMRFMHCADRISCKNENKHIKTWV